MKPYKAIIVDDEKPVLQLMKHVIGRNGRYDVEATYHNPLEAAEAVAAISPDVAFLDIEMPKLSGLELARLIAASSPHTRIVFSTAYRQYALDAFDVNAVDYILKPVTPAAIQRVTERLDQLQPATALGPDAGTVVPENGEAGARSRVNVIRCFGAFEVRSADDELIRWPTRKTEELFAYLLCHPDREISKWRIVDAIWPEMDEERSMNNLYNTVYRLKKVLKDHGIGMDVLKTQDGYALDTGGVGYDLVAFHKLGQNVTASATASSYALEEKACAVYRGSLLEMKDYSWKMPLAEAYGRQYEALIWRIVMRSVEDQDWRGAEMQLISYLAIEPLNERMNGLLVNVYENSGQEEKARKHDRKYAETYQSEFGVEPSAGLR
ncbi:response regulator [Cohnella soli]|uniref:Response regulator n=1 Tax=Cohnella soli TaxID=425005 RepID=A0ABW0HQM5_9BACL